MNVDTKKVEKKMRGFHDGCVVIEGHHFHRAMEYRCLRCGIPIDIAAGPTTHVKFLPCFDKRIETNGYIRSI